MKHITVPKIFIVLTWLAVIALAVMAGVSVPGCYSSIKGGTDLKTSEKTTSIGGEVHEESHETTRKTLTPFQELVNNNGMITVTPDGGIVMAFGKVRATTQPTEETHETTRSSTTQPSNTTSERTLAAATQPSATSSDGGAPKINDHGLTFGFDFDNVKSQAEERWWMYIPFILASLYFLWRQDWLRMVVAVFIALAIALTPGWVVYLTLGIGALLTAFFVYEVEVEHRSLPQVEDSLKNLLRPGQQTPAAPSSPTPAGK